MALNGDPLRLCIAYDPGDLGAASRGLWSVAAPECQWDRLCKGHGVPQDILKTSSGPLSQRFLGSSDVTCCHPQQAFSEVEVEECTVGTVGFAA